MIRSNVLLSVYYTSCTTVKPQTLHLWLVTTILLPSHRWAIGIAITVSPSGKQRAACPGISETNRAHQVCGPDNSRKPASRILRIWKMSIRGQRWAMCEQTEDSQEVEWETPGIKKGGEQSWVPGEVLRLELYFHYPPGSGKEGFPRGVPPVGSPPAFPKQPTECWLGSQII